MYKLSGHSLTRGAWFLPETQPLTLAERDSNSSITLRKGDGAPEIGFNDWLLQDDGPEGPIVWRVKSIDDSVDTKTVTIGLEHVIKILEDQSFFSEVTTAMMAGTPGAATCTAKQAVEYVLAQQSDWVLGDFAYNVSNPYEFDGDGLYDAIETVTDSLEDSVWEYDMSVYPFKLHIRQRDNTVQCEMRGERNLSTLRKSVSRSGMYTRIYPVGKNDLHIDGDYLSENEAVYGRIDKIETDQSKSTKALLQAWALGRLRRHSEPTVTISISGMELATETGEDLDRLTINKICQVPLPEFGTTITERIVKKTWKDWRADPVGVTINLANNSQDVTEIIRNQSKRSGKAAKGNAKQNYLFEANGEHLYYEVFDECGHLHGLLNMTSESLRIAFDNEINSTRSEFMMTSESLRISFENEISSTRSEFQMTSESLRISFENEISSTRSEFQQTADMVGMIVEGTGSNAHIKPAKIQASINAATGDSKILLSADNVEIDGDVVTGALDGEDIVCDSLEAGGLTIGGECEFDINSPIIGGNGGSNEYNWGDVIVNAELLTDNKTLRLTRLDGSTLDFSKATTLSPSWSSGAFPLTVNATQINNGVTTNVGAKTIGFTNAADVYLTVEKNGNPTAFGNSKKLINVPFKIVHHAGGTVGDQDRYFSSLASVDATSVYNNGWDDVVLNDPVWGTKPNEDNTTASNSLIVSASDKTNGDVRSKATPISLTVDTANKKAKVSAGGYVRAIADINMKTNAEYNTAVANAGYAGRAAVTISSTLLWGTNPASNISVSQNTFTVSTAGRTNSSGTIEQDTEPFNLYSQASTSGLTATFYVTIGNSAAGSRVIKKTATCSDSNLVAGNIRNGVSIFGVTGNYVCPSGYVSPEVHSAAVSAANVSGYSNGYSTAKSSTYITNGNINAASIGVYSGHYACNMSLTLNFGDGTTRSADVTGGVIVDDIVAYGQSLGGGGGCNHTSLGSGWTCSVTNVSGSGQLKVTLSKTVSYSTPGGLSDGSTYTLYK